MYRKYFRVIFKKKKIGKTGRRPTFLSQISDQVSHPYYTTGRNVLLCILIFKFFGRKLEDKRF